MTADIKNDLAKIAAQESLLVFEKFDSEDALELGLMLRDAAIEYGQGVAIDISIANEPVFFLAMPGTTASNGDFARRKKNLVRLLERSSYALSLETKLGTDMVEMMALDRRDYGAFGGCFPIRVTGAGMIGTVTISGLPQRDDHKIVVETIAEMLGVELGAASF